VVPCVLMVWRSSAAVGLVVTAAVLTHDFSDGINTVSFILKNAWLVPKESLKLQKKKNTPSNRFILIHPI
jgi:hypothetical protein